MNTLLSQVNDLGNKLQDQSKDTAATSGYTPPAAGKTLARLVEYIELGKQPQRPYQGQEKPPAREVQIGFELVGPKHKKEIEVEGATKVVYPVVRFRQVLSTHSKAGFRKLFSAMNYTGDKTHMAQMLGEGFLVEVVHKEVEKDGNKRVYVNLKDATGWKIGAPETVDAVSGETVPIAVPAGAADYRLYLFDNPTKEQWESIFIEGSREVTVDGEKVTKSNNFLQELVQEAVDFRGSMSENLVAGLTAASPQKEDTPVAEAVEPTKNAATDEDPLADLDL